MRLPAVRPKHWIFNALLLLTCAGCATVAIPPAGPDGFVLRGKLAVVEDGRSVSARFLWRQSGDAFVIDLWGPLGQGQMRLEGNAGELIVRDTSGNVVTRGAHEEVMRAQLGWSLPLAVLPDWVRGRPHPGLPASDRVLDAAGRVASFSQLDWNVLLGRWRSTQNSSAGRDMPHQISAQRGIYRVRLAISQWEI